MLLGYKLNYSRDINYQDLLKMLAIVTMLIDHVGAFLIEGTPMLRVIGRIAMPIFVFFAGYNFRKNISKELFIYGIILEFILNAPKLLGNFFAEHIIIRYILLLFLFYPGYLYVKFFEKFLFKKSYSEYITIIAEMLFAALFLMWSKNYLNILISIYLGQIYIKIFLPTKREATFWYHFIILSILHIFLLEYIEYGLLPILGMISGYGIKSNLISYKKPLIFTFLLLCFIENMLAFYPSFKLFHAVIYLLIQIFLYSLLAVKNFNYEKPVNSFNMIPMSRNSLFIYLFHLLLVNFCKLLE